MSYTDSMSTHKIIPGDTFWALAKKYGYTVEAILAANPSVAPEQLKIAKNPSSTLSTHTIVSGDTLWKLSRKYGCTLNDILTVNPGIIPEQLQIGQIIYLPKPGIRQFISFISITLLMSIATTLIPTSESTIISEPISTNQKDKIDFEWKNNNKSIVVGYFTSWSVYQRNFFVNDIPADKITHINYAFAKIGLDGEIERGDNEADTEKFFPGDSWSQTLRGNFNQLIKLKDVYPHLRTLISVGGWTWSKNFSDIAMNDESRKKFAKSCVKFIEKYAFDGIDLDWEYPVSGGHEHNIHRPEDKQNYVFILKELREQLDMAANQNGKTYLLTVATGASPQCIADMDLVGMATYLDWINVMTYDYHGGWETKTGHNAPLYKNDAETVDDISSVCIKSKLNIHASIQAYIDAGVSRNKLILGIPLYGRGWTGVTSTVQNGFSQSTSGQLPVGTWENGVFDYDHIKHSFCSSSSRYWDDASKVPFLYNSSTGIWISFDDETSIQLKCDYIKQECLGGVMFWELSGDRNNELINVTINALKQ
ncbi:unnamed protein product [Rotaria sp. Silwood2]|nr:unnamed protein product [Rotaria sp. Silwood2]CAF3996937.1 unnamed protein product [Rotaria sp. Silwood2]